MLQPVPVDPEPLSLPVGILMVCGNRRAESMGDMIERGCLTARMVAAAVVFLVLAIPTVLFFGFFLVLFLAIPVLFILALF
jgi:hypothetical protein